MAFREKGRGGFTGVKARTLVGVDFGTESVRVLVLNSAQRDSPTVAAATTIDFEENASFECNFDPSEVSDKLSQFLESNGVTVRPAVVAIPSKHSIVRILSFPYMGPDELKNSIQYEVDQFSAEESGDKMIDYSILRDYTEEGMRKLEVLIAAVPKKFIAPYVETAGSSKLELYAIDLPSFAALKAITYQNAALFEGGAILLHIGSYASELLIIEDGLLRFIRSIKIGGSHVKNAFIEAARSMAGYAVPPPEQIADYECTEQDLNLISHIVNEFLDEVERTIHFCKSQLQRSDLMLSRIVLTGHSIWPRNLDRLISSKTNVQTSLADPFVGSLKVQNGASAIKYPTSFVAALGLTLKGMGL